MRRLSGHTFKRVRSGQNAGTTVAESNPAQRSVLQSQPKATPG